MSVLTIELPAEDQEQKLRRLVAVAEALHCEVVIWPARHLGPGGVTFHAFDNEEPDLDLNDDPLLTSFRSIEYLFEESITREAAAIDLDSLMPR